MSSSELLRVEGLDVAWGRTPVLRDISFRVGEGEFVVLLGPNGSGKTTLLRCLAGLESQSRGRISLRGQPVEDRPAHRRGIGMLFQEPALFPQRTVYENVAYGLELGRVAPLETERRVGELLDLLHLKGLSDRGAGTLSGGERQRVALARTLAPRPALVLLDEPFASVDASLRSELMGEFRDVLRRLETAAVHVTHDRDEGMFLADRLLILLEGQLRRDGPPAAVFRDPRASDVAVFLGFNLLPGPGGGVAVHPRHLRVVAAGRGRLDAEVLRTGWTGTEAIVFLRGPDGTEMESRSFGAIADCRTGDQVGVDWSESAPLAEETGVAPGP